MGPYREGAAISQLNWPARKDHIKLTTDKGMTPSVTWKYMNMFPWSLDRKSLRLTNPMTMPAPEGVRVAWQYECEVLLTKEEFFARMEAYRLNERKELMKGNKI